MAQQYPTSAPMPAFLTGGGEAACLIAARDWADTSLGPISAWPASLRTAVGLVLRSPMAMVLMWGAEGVMLYNDAYGVICGERHPSALGSRARESWPEIAEFNDHVIRTVLAGGTLTYEDQPLTVNRNGQPEQAWFSLHYSGALDDSGEVAGVVAVVAETTRKVVAEQWLRDERERLRQMFAQSPGFMAMLHGPTHVFDLVNPAYSQLVGHREVIGRTVRQALPDIEGQGFYELLDKVYSSGEAFTGRAMPVQLQAMPGGPVEQRFVDLVYQPVRNPAGAVIGIFVQGTDVTDQVVVERMVLASEARHRQILDSATDYAIIALDTEGRVTRWNEGAHRIFGWQEAEMVGHTIERIFTPEDWAAGRLATKMGQALDAGSCDDARWQVRQNGSRFWGNGEMTPLRNDTGEAIGFVKVLRDRTAEHSTQQALRQSEQRLQRAQRAGGVGTFTVDLASQMLYGTPEFYRVFGLPECEAMPARQVEALVLSQEERARASPLQPETGAQLDTEYQIRRASDGEIRWVARKAEYETDGRGRPLRLVGVVQDVTERKTAQRQLDESAAQFITFAQTLPNHVWTARADGGMDWFNDRALRYTGMDAASLQGDRWPAAVHPDDAAAAGLRWRASVESGLLYETEFRIRRADGVYRWHLVRAVPIRVGQHDAEGDGTVHRWVGTNTDIHERKQAEAETLRDRDRLWTLSQEMMLVADHTGTVIAINPAATRLLGWSQQEMTGVTFQQFVHPDDLARTVAELEKLAHGATTLAFENRYLAKDGSYRLLDWTAVPDGTLIHGVARDITGERAAAAELQRIWRSSNDLMGSASLDGTLRAVSPAWTRLLGCEEDALLGHSLAGWVAEADRERLSAMLAGIAAGQDAADLELQMRHHEGRVSLVAWSIERVGDILYVVGRDVTEQRATEDALRQAQKMEAVGQLTGGIAHDFNNLLQGITGSLDLVRRRIAQGRTSELERFVTGAMNSARRAASLTHRLLAFSRRQPLDPRVVQVNGLITSMEELLQRTLGESVTLQMVLADELWPVKCDPNQLENALLNLTINARDAMPDGGLLSIETRNVSITADDAPPGPDAPRPGAYACISVTDTGQGMTPEVVARAFEPFFTTKPLGKGTGLGLSMIYGFARQSEGLARIESTPGQGTTIRLYLPRELADCGSDEAQREAAHTPAARHDETVLVVEDEAVVRGLILEVLAELGYRAIEAADGPAGLAVLQSDVRLDLLISDMGLPGLNGRQMVDASRAHRPDLKVLFMTGYAENAAMASGFLAPGMSLLTKPFALDALATRIREILDPEAR